MSERLFLTGGSGFVGTAVIEDLVARSYIVNALVNRGKLKVKGDGIRPIRGDLFDDTALDSGMQGCAAVIHLVGIIAERPSRGLTFQRIHIEGTKRVVDAAKRNGVRRYIHMSALGTRANAVSEYHKTKWAAEEYVRACGLEWTIFRPSMIHGPGGELTKTLAKWARRKAAPYLFMPYFGAGLFGTGGAGMLQPVYVKDVARGLVDALSNPTTIGQTYEIAGVERLTWPDLHRAAAEAIVGKRRVVLPIPAWYARALTCVTPAALLPFNRDQVIMSQEDNTADLAKFEHDLGWGPRGFRETLKTYAAELSG
jgi:nucleoside-diphosphate-sugar epimerase